MKKIFKFSVIVSLCAVLVSLAGCQKEMNVDPMGENFSFNGLAPNPVMRGGVLQIFGRSLDQVSEVLFAGDVSVKGFASLKKGARLDTLEVVVPVEGPEVGKVTIVAKDGRKLSSLSNLEFLEGIEVSSFSPATVLSGDVITIKGEYLNVVKEIFFSGEDAVAVKFESQSRHELKVKLPANAISGPVILSDVNEIEDQNTIPNHVYSPSELTVGDPTVTKAAKATYKSGDVIKVNGDHLDMIKNVAVPQVDAVDFTIADDFKSISFNLPPKAADGNITLTSYAGKAFDAGEIETVSVTELTVKSLAEDQRYKAGCEVEISGKDLDLVTKVEFTGAEASWYLKDSKIFATQPAAAKDGAITVTLDSGKQAYSDDIVVVKPVVTAIDKTEVVAGADAVLVSGTDLDLVTSAVIGTKDQAFIECQFEFTEDDDKNVVVKVYIPEQAYSAPITLTAESGYETVTDNITVTYDMAVAISFDSPSYGLGSNITITGKNLLQIDQLYVKGKRVVDFAVRAKDSMSFAIPEGIGPGVYRLSMILMDGTELTWPIPFEITAPFTETFIWEGSEAINWTGMQALAWGGYDWTTVSEGTVLCAHFTLDPSADYWQIRFGNGSWSSLPSLAGLAPDGNIPLEPGMTEYKFELTAEDLDALVNQGGLVMTGANYTLTGVSLIVFGAAPAKESVIWEGSEYSGDNYDTNLELGSETAWNEAEIESGNEVRIYFTTTDAEGWQIQVFDGHWSAMSELGLDGDNHNQFNAANSPDAVSNGYVSFTVTDEILAKLTSIQNWGSAIILQGKMVTFTKIVLKAGGGEAPVFEDTVWEGEEYSGDNYDVNLELGSETAWNDAGLAEGDTVKIYFTTTDAEGWQIQVFDGHWSAMSELGLDGDNHNQFNATNSPDAAANGYVTFKVTAEILAKLTSIQNWGSAIILQGKLVTFTKITKY